MKSVLGEQQVYFRAKHAQYGDDPRSVSWNDRESQFLRFRILSELFRYEQDEFTVHEVGCGLGHFGEFAAEEGLRCRYMGSDISPEFVAVCQAKFGRDRFVIQDIAASLDTFDPAVKGCDFYVQSGAFNAIGGASLAEWELFVDTAVENMFAMCGKGIGFNMLSTYSDPEMRNPGLYYADPRAIYDRCKRLSRFVTLISDGPLYEFTVLVYRKEYVKILYPSAEFGKYFVR
jgi:SAM-dependent methyltransferase